MAKVFFISIIMMTVSASAFGSNGTPPLDFFKGLEGTWSIQAGKKVLPIKMSYSAGSKGNIVTENFGKELSVISKDGQSTILTHFCNSGHQSRLKLVSTPSADKFIFEAFDLVNLKSKKDAHVQKIIYSVKSNSLVELEIIWQKDKKETAEKYQLSRL